jgi:hypothetical protein
VVDGLHGNNQISGEAQDVLWKLEERKVRIADHPGVTRFSDSRTLDLLNERVVLISPIENLRSCLPVIVPERTGTKANSSRI